MFGGTVRTPQDEAQRLLLQKTAEKEKERATDTPEGSEGATSSSTPDGSALASNRGATQGGGKPTRKEATPFEAIVGVDPISEACSPFSVRH